MLRKHAKRTFKNEKKGLTSKLNCTYGVKSNVAMSKKMNESLIKKK
jgi:hypothetical protein